MSAHVTIEGHLGRDPEMKFTPSGQPVTEFSVGVSTSRKLADGTYHSDWYRVSVWGKRAEAMADRLRKGSHVLVFGTLASREYVGKDGSRRFSLDVVADDVRPLDKADAGPSEAPTAAHARAGDDELAGLDF